MVGRTLSTRIMPTQDFPLPYHCRLFRRNHHCIWVYERRRPRSFPLPCFSESKKEEAHDCTDDEKKKDSDGRIDARNTGVETERNGEVDFEMASSRLCVVGPW